MVSPNDKDEITVAFLGYSSVGKTTALNAVLKNNFSYISKKKATFGINYFRIQDKKRSTQAEIDNVKKADSICTEIARDNKVNRKRILSNLLRNVPSTKIFDIAIEEPALKIREDKRLVFADIPGIDFTNADCAYRKYVDESWQTFDCVVLVLDLDEPEKKQSPLLRYIRKKCEGNKALPIVVIGNERGSHIGASPYLTKTQEMVDELFSGYSSDNTFEQICLRSESTERDISPKRKPMFVSVNLQNALRYRLAAAKLTLDEVSKLGACTIDSICIDEVGENVWEHLQPDERLDVVHSALITPGEEYKLSDTNFQMLMAKLERVLVDIQSGKPLGDIEDQVVQERKKSLCDNLNDMCDKARDNVLGNDDRIPTIEELRAVSGLADTLSDVSNSRQSNIGEDEDVEVILQILYESDLEDGPVLENKGEKICKQYSPVVTTLLALITLVLIGALVVICLWKFEVLQF